ncbi:phage holin family protein [Colidextribacter sp. 210702-DFI.3.9]|nr:phage holin family protein [Colidextribacter sp. 210702-DFI.3.9]
MSNEGISIFGNVCKIGLPLPGRLKNLLEKFKDIKNQAE